MQNSENPETEVPIQNQNISQPIANLPTPTQTQTPDPTQATLPTSRGKLLKIILVIIAVLAIIAALITAGFYLKKFQDTKKRDATRKSDITVIQKGLEKYKQDTLDTQYYPTAASPYTLEKTGYIDKFPQDPKNASPYIYKYDGLPVGCVGNCTGYTLTACLENKNDKGKNTTSPIAPCTTRSYQISK